MSKVPHTVAEIKAALAANGNICLDDHGDRHNERVVKAIAQHGRYTVMLLPDSNYFSINCLYIGDDRKVHLSSWSVGGCIDLRKCDLEEGIKAYNDPANWMPTFKGADITNVTYL